ncbi:hypothetical protein [Geminicoccus harenae]|nr:hypothetical protein [Geminicoccus harenae]
MNLTASRTVYACPGEVPMSVYEMVGWIAAALAAWIVSGILLGIWSIPK